MKRSLLAQTAAALMALACFSAAQSAEPEKSNQGPDSVKPEEGLAGLVYLGNVLEHWAKHCRFDKMQSSLHVSRLSLQASLQSTAKFTAPEPKRAQVQASLVKVFRNRE